MKKKTLIISLLVLVAACAIGGGAYYHVQEKKAEEARRQAIEEAVQNAKDLKAEFTASEERETKLKLLLNMKDKISNTTEKEVLKELKASYKAMQAWFEEDYENTFKNCSIEDLSGYTYAQIEDLENGIDALAALKETINSEFVGYGTVEQDVKDAFDAKIEKMSKTISDKTAELNTKHDEETAAAKEAEEERQKQAASSSSGSGYSGNAGSASGGSSSQPSNLFDRTDYITWEQQWQIDSNGNKIEGSDMYYASDGNVYDANGNYMYNLGDPELGLDIHY